MGNASLSFIAFGLAAAVLSNLSAARAWRSFVLLCASVIFLVLVDRRPLDYVPLVAFLLLGYGCIALLERGWLRVTAWSVCTVILAYAWLKKYTFLPPGSFLHVSYTTLGLSYIFFRVLSLVIEADSSRDRPGLSFGAYLLYLLNFTTFISGPIQRYDDFAKDQFAGEPIPLGVRSVGLQLERLARGFFKVNVLALLLNMIHTDALGELAQPTHTPMRTVYAMGLASAYPFFLYANFSGYIDIVIAIARLMRVRLPENFDRPFSACSFLDFWNRWHITLSQWLKTYVFNPLLVFLMRRVTAVSMEPVLAVICFFVTFFLVGIWHGRTSEFAFFGVLQGGGVAVNKLWQVMLTKRLGRKGYGALAKGPVYRAVARGLTFSWFAFSLFWFWASWQQIHAVFSAISPGQWVLAWLGIWVLATVVLAAWEALRRVLLSVTSDGGPVLLSRYARVVYASAFGAVTLVISTLLNQPAPEVVYKAF